jgi:hypothetical protein
MSRARSGPSGRDAAGSTERDHVASPRTRRAVLAVLVLALLVVPVGPALALPSSSDYGSSIDGYARYDVTFEECSNVEQPGVVAFRQLLREKYGANLGGILRTCDRNTRSAHQSGRAYDWMLNAGNAADRAKADEVLGWLLATDEYGNRHAMARRLGVMYIIWNRQWWTAWNPDAGWQPYTGWSPHTDHIHFSFSWPGARQETSFWGARCAVRGHALAGDWDGSGQDGQGWWCDGVTRLRTAGGTIHEFRYGRAGDVPVVADWNGNGQDTVSVIRDGTWHVNNALRGGTAERTFTYGRVTRGDVPIAGAWDGGALDLPGIIRDTEWHLRAEQSGGPATWEFVYGRLSRGDQPLWGDWNGDGRDTVGIVREREWHLRNSHAGGPADIAYIYGRVTAGDRPLAGDWNGDGRDTPAIVRNGEWHLRYVHEGGQADAVIPFPAP